MDEEEQITVAAGERGSGMAAREESAAAGEDLPALREALLRAYPRAVPELVGGASVGEMLASLEGAQAAWERVAASVGAEARVQAEAQVAAARPPAVPAGAAPAAAADPERLPATEKIRRGLLGRRG